MFPRTHVIAELLEQLMAALARAERDAPEWASLVRDAAARAGIVDLDALAQSLLSDEDQWRAWADALARFVADVVSRAEPLHPSAKVVRELAQRLSDVLIDAASGGALASARIDELLMPALDRLSARLVDAAMSRPMSRPAGGPS